MVDLNIIDLEIEGKPRFAVSGKDTFDTKEEIKKHTNKWDSQRKAWILPESWSEETCQEWIKNLRKRVKNSPAFGEKQRQRFEVNAKREASEKKEKELAKKLEENAEKYKKSAERWKQYYDEINYPMFHPPDGNCMCNRNVFEYFDPDKNLEPITGCPFCGRSYCD